MADTKLPEQDDGPEHLWTLIKQLKVSDLVNTIKQIGLNDCEHLVSIARGRPLNLETCALLCKEIIKTRTGRAVLSAVTATIGIIIISVYSKQLSSLCLAGLGYINAAPALGLGTATESTSSAGEVIGPLQSAAVAGYEDTIVVACAYGAVIAVTICVAYKTWNMYKHKDA